MRKRIIPVVLSGAAAAMLSLGALAQDVPPPGIPSPSTTTMPGEAQVHSGTDADLKARFSELDSDGDGRISRSDLGGDSTLQQRFDQIDLERDGYVTRAEVFADGGAG